MKIKTIWNAVGTVVVSILLACGVYLMRIDAVLRRKCKDALFRDFFGQTGLCLLMLLIVLLVGFVLWQWIAARPLAGWKRLAILAAGVLLFVLLAHGYAAYHHTVYIHSAHQRAYDKLYARGLLYDLRGLFR